MRWWYQDPFDSLWHDPTLRTAMTQTLKLSVLTVILAISLYLFYRFRRAGWV